ncbi:helix-turn-helix domain-containing protein [Legionella longbeachae]|uniref:Putative transcriptional regulator, AraC family n=1 Tax=Legionella longbeachae serogroup 1 (strain NSW150) TaxID=661367 RepID=D3HNH2_LEGLN|nr:AraC family transcriptional regulator [Legionella longbeachae]VEE00961.1 AraC family transcriptional regulator [Legionella oakridgensis]HBD7399299.1 helix-turn-helix transcriptional regulator [Legionella pneumophila]ARB92652.1 AraC family transcriptional regulator [Legionella longbeachae]ARM34173.1 helix-turn-helix transcriptional regulator [Legionella longbeachae]EEZ96574.1 AraC family transcriptional regulator [Legionella longbeachae D-4968]
MKKGKDISVSFDGLYLIHQNLPGKQVQQITLQEALLFIPLQGEISIILEGKALQLGVSKMLYLPPNLTHSFSSTTQRGERLIALIDSNKYQASFSSSVPSILPVDHLIKELLFYLLLHPKTNNAQSLIQVFCETLQEIFMQTSSNYIQSVEHLEAKASDPRLKIALNYMREHLAENINMNDVARHSGLSSRSLNRLAAIETGLQPKQWLIHYRITKAKELLRLSGNSVTQVAFKVGYNSLGQFIATFRTHTGQLPSEYLNMAKN